MTAKQTIALHLNLPQLTEPLSAAYLEMGKGETLLLLHGFMGQSECWSPLMERLQPQIHCVALDLLGFGASAKPHIRYDIAREVEFVRQFVLARNLGRCTVLGHSFGGWVAAAYALAYPDAVNGLILAAAAGIRDDSFCGRYNHLRPILWDTPIVDWLLTLARPIVQVAGQQNTLERVAWMRREILAQPAARSFLLDRLRPEDAIDTVEQQIHQVKVPTLVITGDQDETIPLWHSETYARSIPGAKLVIVPDADHALPTNYVPQLAQHVLSFLGVAE